MLARFYDDSGYLLKKIEIPDDWGKEVWIPVVYDKETLPYLKERAGFVGVVGVIVPLVFTLRGYEFWNSGEKTAMYVEGKD